MPVIVDTYNVLHVTGILPPELAGIDVAELAALIEASRYGSETVWLVCDGRPTSAKAHRRGRIVTHYSGTGSDADAHIARMVEASSTPRRLTIVSSDHRVRRMALRRRCSVLASEVFLAHLAADAARVGRPAAVRPPVPLDRRQVDRWVHEFGLEGAWLELPGGAAPRERTAPPVQTTTDAPADADGPSEPASPVPPGPAESSPRRRRALEGVERLDQVDPAELERFDMNEWLPANDRPNRAARRKRAR